ncbi:MULTISPECIES: hypothetical protein [unclassified Acinetobacter]|uniref:hypothetical protein n=1 Tax=unclassified Acinetobacter TaxID=196816 RepID=UPI00190D9854|nr:MULTISPECIES: hypothetical protein [unclassified Acinetobacter]MBK0062593.1 hypothetical protein [Acinetobacter sp. S55]MBK0065830.1 hypothetical protein [Acinetobacter sp. S54]
MFKIEMKETIGSKSWSINVNHVSDKIKKRSFETTRPELHLALLFMHSIDDYFTQFIKKVLNESTAIQFTFSISEVIEHDSTEASLFKEKSSLPEAGKPLVVVDFEGDIFSPVLYDADKNEWVHQSGKLRSVIIHQWAYQTDVYKSLNLPSLNEEIKQNIQQQFEEECRQEKQKKRGMEKQVLEGLKNSLKEAFPDASIEINAIKF